MPLHYTLADSGGWIAICTPTRLLLVGGAVDDATVASLWRDLSSAEGMQQALELLTRHGLAATPPFALVETGEHGRTIVRGDVTVTITGASGVESLSGAGVTTWTERPVGAISELAMAVGGATGTRSLPLAAGVVLAASVDWVGGATAESVPKTDVEAEISEETVVVPPRAKASEPRGPESEAPAPEAHDPEATVTELPMAGDLVAGQLTAGELTAGEPTAGKPVANAAIAATESGYDYLFGDTVFRTVAGAAVIEEPAPEAPAPGRTEEPVPTDEPPQAEAAASMVGDHDGMTVMTSDIAKMRRERKDRTKGKRDPAPAAPAAPVLVLALPNGAREPLSQPILVGRAPSVSQVSGPMMPKLVTIGTSDQDISRTHARFALEGGTVVVTDLHSRNGTMVKLPGKEPQKLRAGEPTSVLPGTIVDFGGGLTLKVDED